MIFSPANPQVVYVPVYNPEYIWGPPAWGYYPPLYYPAFGFGFGFGPGIYIGGFFGGLGWGGWGWGPNWFGFSIFERPFFFSHYGYRGFAGYGYGRFGSYGVWAHNPEHRLGVAYPNRAVANRFGGFSGRGAAVAGEHRGVERATAPETVSDHVAMRARMHARTDRPLTQLRAATGTTSARLLDRTRHRASSTARLPISAQRHRMAAAAASPAQRQVTSPRRAMAVADLKQLIPTPAEAPSAAMPPTVVAEGDHTAAVVVDTIDNSVVHNGPTV